MSILTTGTAVTVGMKALYEPGFQRLVWRNNSLFPLFGAFRDSGGNTHFRWKANTSGNSSVELYTEDQVQPAPGHQSYVDLAQAYLAFRFMTRVTGHARAALRSQHFNVIETDQTLGTEDMVDLMTTTFMASTYGLEAHIAATGTYGGVARGSTSYIESSVSALNRSIALTDILDIVETLSTAERGRRPNLLLGPVNQQTNIYQFGAPAGMKVFQGGSDPAPNFNPSGDGYTIAGMKPAFLPDWTTTVLCFLRREDVLPIEHQPYLVKEMAPSGDSDVYQTSWMGLLLHIAPLFAGKYTSVTA